MESTGIYHQLLAQRAHHAGMQVYVLNARDVYFYAKALGARGKTDRVDAGLIARYAAEHHAKLHAWQPGNGAHKHVEELLGRRATLVTKRESVRQAFKGDHDLAGQLKQLDLSFEHVLAAIDAKVDERIAGDSALATGRKRIASVTGFGPHGSALLAVLFARIPFANVDAVVAYSGLYLRLTTPAKSAARANSQSEDRRTCAGSCTCRASPRVTAKPSSRYTRLCAPRALPQRRHSSSWAQVAQSSVCRLEDRPAVGSSQAIAKICLTKNIEPQTAATNQFTKRASARPRNQANPGASQRCAAACPDTTLLQTWLALDARTPTTPLRGRRYPAGAG